MALQGNMNETFCCAYFTILFHRGVFKHHGTTTEVEKYGPCIKMAQQDYPDSCTFPNILDLVANRPQGRNWNPHKLKLKKTAYCATHRNQRLTLTFCWGVQVGNWRTERTQTPLQMLELEVPFERGRAQSGDHWCSMHPAFKAPLSLSLVTTPTLQYQQEADQTPTTF